MWSLILQFRDDLLACFPLFPRRLYGMFSTFSATTLRHVSNFFRDDFCSVSHFSQRHILLIQEWNFIEIEYSSKERSLKSRWMFFLVSYTLVHIFISFFLLAWGDLACHQKSKFSSLSSVPFSESRLR